MLTYLIIGLILIFLLIPITCVYDGWKDKNNNHATDYIFLLFVQICLIVLWPVCIVGFGILCVYFYNQDINERFNKLKENNDKLQVEVDKLKQNDI